ncbi:MAG: hypothetical protein J5793_01320 [Clostridia bacterium]|nr:hypothetical protein [Clostridia bacterium]
MDYQGDYFPEERDERESKSYRIIKNIFKWTMYGCSLIVWILVIYFIIINGDKDIIKKNYMTDISGYGDIDTESVKIYRINPSVFMNEDASMQVYNVDYAPEYGLLEMGIRFNATKLTDGNNGDVLSYVLRDSEGNEYALVNRICEKNGRNGFARICFAGLEIDLESNIYKLRNKADENGDIPLPVSDVTYTLSVYYDPENAGSEPLFVFTIYNNDTVVNTGEYKKG